MELEAVRNEYSNAQLECNAADERAKLLASEVISLEEKVVLSVVIQVSCLCVPMSLSLQF